MKRNIKILGVIGLLGVFGCGYLVYGYSSVGDSLNYIKSSGDTGHVGYILTEIFGNDDKIDSKYLDITGTSVTGATINNSGVVQLVNSTGSTSQTQAPTINLMTQVWNQLSASINTKISTELDPTVNSLAKAVLSCSDNQIVKRSGVTWVCSNYVDTSYTHPVGDGNLHVPVTSTTNSGKVLMAGGSAGNIFWSLLQKADIGLGNVDNTSDVNKPVSSATQSQLNLKANIASPMLTGTPSSQEVLNVNDNDSSLATTKFVQDRVSAVSAAGNGIVFSNCSTTDQKQQFYECDPSLSACSTAGAYCGGGTVAGVTGGSIIVGANSDEGYTSRYTSGSGDEPLALKMCWEKGSFGFDDRILPTTTELSLLNNSGKFGYFGNHWTSQDAGGTYAYYGFYSYTADKSTSKPVRCIRRY